jgi:hypothetical protein
MKNTAFLTKDEDSLYEDYTFLGISSVKGILNCNTDIANKTVRAILKKVRENKTFEERQKARYDKVQTAISQAKFDGELSYRVMSEV